ncbi:hypothetical protein G6W57_04780 [Streptomyces sp. CAI-121]|uniref:hypothetical protein n=1 Tax=unclassified Streptomyces TaxID=2593676 RepID=UPI00158714C4|nr:MULTISPECIES: hypothetical protein [unclassified Streptomyces]NUV66427.1 hypothetical protein [Streptomyces sp. CAI-121]NUW11891.1 hypothetical protein [Streptomyces sp. CAI-68]
MTGRRRTGAAVLSLVLALTAGGLIWGFGPWGEESDPADTCRGSLAVEEAGKFFGGAELEFSGHAEEWMGHETEYCTAQARSGESGGVRLKLSLRPAAAHRASRAAEETSAAPIGYGWNGSFDAGYHPAAAVLVDCAPLPGKGLLVLADIPEDIRKLSDEQVSGLARFTTESARLAAKRYNCEGPLGKRPSTVDRTRPQEYPVARTKGTCRDVVTARDIARLELTNASEMPAGRALTEECSLDLPAKGHSIRLTAYYGPSAQQEMYLDKRYPGSVKGAIMRSHPCDGALGTAYFKFEELPLQDAGKYARKTVRGEDGQRLLTAFTAASAARHGCPVG